MAFAVSPAKACALRALAEGARVTLPLLADASGCAVATVQALSERDGWAWAGTEDGDVAARLRAEVAGRIVGQERVLDEILMALLAGGHALLVGVPGLAKTLMIRSVSEAMRLGFRRIQFTPDLVPSDITGTEVMEEDPGSHSRLFRFVQGPIFANIVLADEINRAPPRTQAALLEAMQEHCVTVAGETMPLPAPFFVLATQNPIEQEGTYPLPEAQLDRFLFDIRVSYPDEEAEIAILRNTTGRDYAPLEPVIDAAQTIALQPVMRVNAVMFASGHDALLVDQWGQQGRSPHGRTAPLVQKMS